MSPQNHQVRAWGDRPKQFCPGIAITGCLGSVVGSLFLAQVAIAGPVNLDGSTPNSQLSVSNCGTSDCTVSSTASGDHYFHSFDSFTLNEGVTLTFSAPTGVERIFSRLTGSASSVINGKLQVEGNADFFLLSPNGLLIGRNGQIETGGSFTGSTARSIEFSNGRFSASNLGAPPILTIGQEPIGLRFLGAAAGVEVQGATGSVSSPNDAPPIWLNTEGGTFSLIGGRASETYIERRILDIQEGGASIATVGPGFLQMTNNGNGYNFAFPTLTDNLNNDVRLSHVIIRSASGGTQGNLTLYGDLVSIDSSSEISIVAEQSDILFQGNDIELDSLELTQTAATGGLTLETTGLSGNDIELTAVNLSLNIGNGDLTLNAGDDLELITTDISLNADSGNLTLDANDNIQAFTNSSVVLETLVGHLDLEAKTQIDIQNSEILLSLQDSPALGSNLNITTDELILRDSSLIQTEFFDLGPEGGELNIDVEGVLNIAPFGDNDIFIQAPSPRAVTFLDEQPSTSLPGLNTTDSRSFARGNAQSDIGYISTAPVTPPAVTPPMPPPSSGALTPPPLAPTAPTSPLTPPAPTPPLAPSLPLLPQTPSVPTPSAPTPSAPTPSAPTPSAPTTSAPTPSAPGPLAPRPPAPQSSTTSPSAPNQSPQTSSTDSVAPSTVARLLSYSATARDENETEIELSSAPHRDRPYAIASLCQAQRSSQLLMASDRGGIAASPRNLAMTSHGIADLGSANFKAEKVASTTLAAEYFAPDLTELSSPSLPSEAVHWQTDEQGKIRLISQGISPQLQRLNIRCEA